MRKEIKSTWCATRWSGIGSFIKDIAWTLGLDCELEIDKGIIFERGRLKISGEKEKVEEFERIFEVAIEEFNKN